MRFEEYRQLLHEKETTAKPKNLMQGLQKNEVKIPAEPGWDFL